MIVVGGGPAGSVAAAVLARAGLKTLLLEAQQHPRCKVGESLLPGIIPILEDIGALQQVSDAGFARKTGSTLWNWGQTPKWELWFADSDAYESAWFVDRARFDALLFAHARDCGAQTRAQTAVRRVICDPDGAPCGVELSTHTKASAELRARAIIDASGPARVVCGRFTSTQAIPGLQHAALWAHFDNASTLPPPRANQALFIAQSQRWWWMFPLGSGRCSVGMVALDTRTRRASQIDFDTALAECAELTEVLGPHARRCTEPRLERDWSYRSDTVAGPGWFAVGDAAGFIDPVLSTGVMLAMHTGWHAATCIAKALAGEISLAQAAERYRAKHHEMFDDLLRMVQFYYRQNLDRDDYFWESKRILGQSYGRPDPHKAFVLLTSGLVANLPLQASESTTRERVEGDSPTLGESNVATLGFVCVHLRLDERVQERASAGSRPPVAGSSLFLLIELRDPAKPALFRTRGLNLNAIAPRHGNDPIGVPWIRPAIESFAALVRTHDQADTLAALWTRLRQPLQAWTAELPAGMTFVRAFGE